MSIIVAAAAAFLGSVAQQPQPAATPVVAPAVAPAQPVISAPAHDGAVLRVGTEVPLRLVEELTTRGRNLRVGHRFRMETSEAVLVNGVTVVPPGMPAVGEITSVRNKGMWGRSGQFTARMLYMTVNGRQVRLSGGFDDKGRNGGIGAVAVSAIVFLPAGFFMTGTSALLPSGTIVKGFVDEDVPLAMAAAAPQPLQVVVPAAAPAPVSTQSVTPASAASTPRN